MRRTIFAISLYRPSLFPSRLENLLHDDEDTGEYDNSFGLPGYPYEMALAILDHGELFYPASQEISSMKTSLKEREPIFLLSKMAGLQGSPSFFLDVMIVNGKIWPKMDVEPRKYRLRLLNGCDSLLSGVALLRCWTC